MASPSPAVPPVITAHLSLRLWPSTTDSAVGLGDKDRSRCISWTWESRVGQRLVHGVQHTLLEHGVHQMLHDCQADRSLSTFRALARPRQLYRSICEQGLLPTPGSVVPTESRSKLLIVKMLNALGKQRQGRLHTPLQFSSEVLRNEALVGRLARQHCLDAHNGCVNTVEWNEQGNLLLSGSDDHCITLWRWPEGRQIRSQVPSMCTTAKAAVQVPL